MPGKIQEGNYYYNPNVLDQNQSVDRDQIIKDLKASAKERKEACTGFKNKLCHIGKNITRHSFSRLARTVRAHKTYNLITIKSEKDFKRAYAQLFKKEIAKKPEEALKFVNMLNNAAKEDKKFEKLLRNNTPGLRKQLAKIIENSTIGMVCNTGANEHEGIDYAPANFSGSQDFIISAKELIEKKNGLQKQKDIKEENITPQETTPQETQKMIKERLKRMPGAFNLETGQRIE